MDSSKPDYLPPHEFAVLLILADGPAHGYEISRAARRGGLAYGQLQSGAVYRVLRQLLGSGLIAKRSASAEARRVVYQLTPIGRDVGQSQAQRMTELASRWMRLTAS